MPTDDGGSPLLSTAAKPWLASYPAGVPEEIDPSRYRSLTELLEEAFRKHARSCAARSRRNCSEMSRSGACVTGPVRSGNRTKAARPNPTSVLVRLPGGEFDHFF